jgi:hypothetical protein
LVSTASFEGLNSIKYNDQLIILKLFNTNFVKCIDDPRRTNNENNSDKNNNSKRKFDPAMGDDNKAAKKTKIFETEKEEIEYKVCIKNYVFE